MDWMGRGLAWTHLIGRDGIQRDRIQRDEIQKDGGEQGCELRLELRA